nr:hypothetical protein [uncultured Rhodopila sp.]
MNAVSNVIGRPTRPEWIAHTDCRPIVPGEADALTRHAEGFGQAAE